MISDKEMAELQQVWQHEASKFNWLAENVPQLLEQMRNMLLSYQALQNEVVALRAMHGFQTLDQLNGVSDGEAETQESTVRPEAGASGDQGVHSGEATEGSGEDSGGDTDDVVPRAEATEHTGSGLRHATNNRRRNRRGRKKNKR